MKTPILQSLLVGLLLALLFESGLAGVGDPQVDPGANPALVGEQVDRRVICTGGARTVSAQHQLMSTIGQTSVGLTTSALHQIAHGFVLDFGSGGGSAIPHVIGRAPNHNEMNVEPGYTPGVLFDTEMDPATLHENTFAVYGNLTGKRSGVYTYTGLGINTAVFDPDGLFLPGEVVSATVTTDPATPLGNNLESPFIWQFTIAADPAAAEFPEHIDCPAGSSPAPVAVADVDHDGDLDVVAGNLAGDNVSVIVNNGDGTFAASVEYGTADYPLGLGLPDLNADGYPDIVTANYGDNDNTSVLINNGDGTFAARVDYPAQSGPEDVAWGDLDGDADLDVITTGSGGLAVYFNDGTGALGTFVPYSSGGAWPTQSRVVDIDNDADLDVVVGNGLSADLSVFLNDGDGTLAGPTLYSLPHEGGKLVLADFNSDTHPDIAVTHRDANQYSVLLNNGNGTFGLPSTSDVGDLPVGITCADVDGDGNLDLVIGYDNLDEVWVLTGAGDGSFGPAIPITAFSRTSNVAAADVDGDGDMDVLTSQDTGPPGVVAVFRNQSASCCGQYTGGYTGNTDCDIDGKMNLQDITRLIDRIYLSQLPLCCEENGDTNGDGTKNLQDVTRLIDHIYLSKAPTALCP